MRHSILLSAAIAILFFTPVHDAMAHDAVDANQPTKGTHDLVVHEWGTFTTFSGSDGVYLDFRPLADQQSDLPDFVFNRASSARQAYFTKTKLRGKVRMETPVTYFYTDQICEVNVRVDFPSGLLTEFYPPVRQMLPPLDEKVAFTEGEPLGNSRLDWGRVTLIPVDQLAPNVQNPQLRAQISQHLAKSAVPRGSNDHHYVQARATDSALVHVSGSTRPGMMNGSSSQGDFMEKFLFYRGVGRFELPVRAVFDQQEQVALRNEGQLPLNSAILIDVRSNQIRAQAIGRVPANREIPFGKTREMTLEELSTVVKGVLISEGLYQKEAASMVETWKQSWFGEEGTRVLYIVPEQTTDELLPLTITPRPRETLRVLVGRMEIMSPAAEKRLINAVQQSSQTRAAYLAKPKEYRKQNAFPVSEQIRSFGRMTDPALVRVSKIAADAATRAEAERLIIQVRPK
jgi:hypothetical protein